MLKLTTVKNEDNKENIFFLPVAHMETASILNRPDGCAQVGTKPLVVRESAEDIARMIAAFRQAEFEAKSARSVEATLARMEHGPRDFPLSDFPAFVRINEDGEVEVCY